MAHYEGRAQHPHHDKPRTPYRRLLDSSVLSPEQTDRLAALHAATNPAELTRNINRIQQLLIASAKDKTLILRDSAS